MKTIAAIFPPTLLRWCLKGSPPPLIFPADFQTPLAPSLSASWNRLLFAAASSVLSRVKVLRFGFKLWPQLLFLTKLYFMLLLLLWDIFFVLFCFFLPFFAVFSVAFFLAGGHISLCSIKPKRRQRDVVSALGIPNGSVRFGLRSQVFCSLKVVVFHCLPLKAPPFDPPPLPPNGAQTCGKHF